MKNLIKGLVVAGFSLALPFAAMAATISNPVFSNGDTTIDATGGSTVSGTFTLQVGAGEVCEVLRTQSDPSQPIKDTSVGGALGYQFGTQANVAFSVKVPPNTGTYFPTVQCAGIWGGNRSQDGADGVVVGPTPLGTLRVVANASSGGNTAPSGVTQAQWDAFLAFVQGGSTPPAPTGNAAKCALIAPYLGAQAYAYSPLGVQLQSVLLLDNPNSIPALHAGATIPMGYFGPQTHAALSQYQSMYGCH